MYLFSFDNSHAKASVIKMHSYIVRSRPFVYMSEANLGCHKTVGSYAMLFPPRAVCDPIFYVFSFMPCHSRRLVYFPAPCAQFNSSFVDPRLSEACLPRDIHICVFVVFDNLFDGFRVLPRSSFRRPPMYFSACPPPFFFPPLKNKGRRLCPAR